LSVCADLFSISIAIDSKPLDRRKQAIYSHIILS
jgi:hypothetical protein